ncbi:MAG: OmpA family protein [Labilithrix sp.]|nr:OmpA family protein [Labilithrix sp.]MCW5812280.1 OmpA family protein [Labilithrix sp.]
MRHRILGLLAGAVVATAAVDAEAQQARGFAINRFEPSARGSEWFVLDTLDLRGNVRPAVGAVAEWARNPLVIYNRDGSVRSRVVSDQFVVHLGGSVNLFDTLRLNLNVPLYAYTTGESGTINGVTYAAPTSNTTFGDIRLGGDVKLAGEYRSAFSLAAGVNLWIPTATEGSYSSEGSARFSPHLIAAGEVGVFVYSVRAGFMYRARTEPYAGSELGSEITFGGAAGLRLLDGKMVVGPELYGSTIGKDFFGRKATPVEGLLGTHVHLTDSFRIAGGVAMGFTRGFGAPETRLLFGLEWMPAMEKERKDSDGDGIYDDDDACPDVKGVASKDPKKHGCPVEEEEEAPPPSDRDKDGIYDDRDACPDDPGPKSSDPKKNGCPDRDGDGVIDKEDACVDEPGVASSDPKRNGCPEDPDRDKDGVPNEQDACPDEPGKPDKDPRRNGCPQAFIKDGQIKILDQVKFATNSTAIVPGKDSESILEAVKTVLDKHPEITKLRVEGHTDNRGKPAANQKLSEGRAASVVKWLVKKGIAADRLTSKGYGQDRPMSENTTEEGRRENRRVEFHIESQQEKPQ